MKKLLFIVIACLLLVGPISAQRVNKISTRCPSPSKLYSLIAAQRDGTLVYTPCAGFASIFTGLVDFTGATVSGLPSGSGTANTVPLWSSASVLGDSFLTQSANRIQFGSAFNYIDTVTGQVLLGDTSTNTNAGGLLVNGVQTRMGDVNGAGNSTRIEINDTATTISLLTNSGNNYAELNGTTNAGFFGTLGAGLGINGNARTSQLGATANNLTNFSIDDTTRSFTFNVDSPLNLAIFDLAQIYELRLYRTITPGGTTGNQVIDKPAGTVNFAAGATQVIVTNGLASIDSIIFLTPQGNDATCKSFTISNKTGSAFRINADAACTAETPVGFWVTK